MSKLIYTKIEEKIKSAEKILLVTDDKIDGDTIGSTLGMMFILKNLGKKVKVFSPKPILSSLEFLPGVEFIEREARNLEDFEPDLVLIFDASEGKHLWVLLDELRIQVPVVVFDHHASNLNYGDINLIEVNAASTGDVVWRFVKWANYEVGREAAQCFLTAICTDTNVFNTSNTTVDALQAAHELVSLGAKFQVIVRETMLSRAPKILKLWGRAFERLHFSKTFDALTTVILEDDLRDLDIDDAQASELSEFLNAMVIDFDKVVVLREADGGVKGSLRASVANVKKIAEQYGGGGHNLAAGFFVGGAKLQKVGDEWEIVEVDKI